VPSPPTPLRVRLSDPELADELAAALSEGDCVCLRVEHDSFLVVHREARDDHEARLELEFFLKAWLARFQGVQAAVS